MVSSAVAKWHLTAVGCLFIVAAIDLECSSEIPAWSPQLDPIPPSPVGDLSAFTRSHVEILLTGVAPGGNRDVGGRGAQARRLAGEPPGRESAGRADLRFALAATDENLIEPAISNMAHDT